MKKIGKIFFYISINILYLINIFEIHGQLNFTSYTDKSKVGLYEQFSLIYSVNEDIDKFTPPNLNDFIIISGPSSSSSTTIINGKISKESTYTYYLRPKKIGVFLIDKAYIKINDKIYSSKTLSIQVLKSPVNQNTLSPESKAKKNVFLKLNISNPKPYSGEQIILTYNLFFSQDIRSPELIKESIYQGFWSENIDLGDSYPIVNKTINNKVFKVATIKKVILIPQKVGELNITKMQLDVPVVVKTNQRDIFGRQRSRLINIICSTKDKIINVIELPKKNKPKNFSGAVGNFSFSTKIDADSTKINESITLSLRVSGDGNLKMFNLPEFNIPSDIETFDPKYNEDIKIGQQGLNGFKRAEYLLIPRNKGTYKIDSINFNFFSLKENDYKTIKKPLFNIYVYGDAAKKEILSQYNKEDVKFIGKDILYIKKRGKLYKYNSKLSFYDKLYNFIIPFFLIFLFILLKYFIKKNNIKFDYIFKGSILSQALKELKNNNSKDLSNVNKAIQIFLELKFQIKKSNFNSNYIKEFLIKKKYEESIIDELIDLIDSYQSLKFSKRKVNQDFIKNKVNKTKELLTKIDKI